MEAKTPKRKSDYETIACLASNWSMHIYLRQDQKLLSLLVARERLRAYDTLLSSSGSVLMLVVASTTMHPSVIDGLSDP
ncbi:hypothetical protein GW17_00016767 [Ensete ventricosum]|nr:hypothetical protein GW17_00016767 [Ensete ventricosum]